MSTPGYWHTGTRGKYRLFYGLQLARDVLTGPAMNVEWQKLGRPAVFGFLFGLVVTAAIAYALPAVGAGSAEVVKHR